MMAAVMAAVFGGAGAAQATPVYFAATNSNTTISFQGGMVAGAIFTAISDLTYNSLGFIDLKDNPVHYNEFLSSDGLHGSYTVGIWLVSTQQLLASTVVTPESTLIGGFRYAPIPTTTITAGQSFIVAALLPENLQDGWLQNMAPVNSLGVSGPGSGRYDLGSTLDYPAQIALTGSPAWGVANASDAMVVPEPGTTAYLLLVLGGMAMSRRRRLAKANA